VTRTETFQPANLQFGDALSYAHQLAFAPYAFYAAVLLRDLGLLDKLRDAGPQGLSQEELAQHTGLSDNSAHSLIESALAAGLATLENRRFVITLAGKLFITLETVRRNTDFMRDVCLPGISGMQKSLEENRPVGLQNFGPWSNLFEGLNELPERTRKSWFRFNNHHSAQGFRDAMPLLFEHSPKKILDIGGSTGRFARTCLDYDADVFIGLADLFSGEEETDPQLQKAVLSGRVRLYAVDILETETQLPEGYDTIWMSQFMPCFSEEQIKDIFKKCHDAIPADGRIYLMENFWDRQKHGAAKSILQLTSLYFVNVATGVSRMWSFEQLSRLIEECGFRIAKVEDEIGQSHSILCLEKLRVES
jgi:hypothetical protein